MSRDSRRDPHWYMSMAGYEHGANPMKRWIQSCQQGTLQADGGGILVWTLFRWAEMAPVVHILSSPNPRYQDMLDEIVLLTVLLQHPTGDLFFQQDVPTLPNCWMNNVNLLSMMSVCFPDQQGNQASTLSSTSGIPSKGKFQFLPLPLLLHQNFV